MKLKEFIKLYTDEELGMGACELMYYNGAADDFDSPEAIYNALSPLADEEADITEVDTIADYELTVKIADSVKFTVVSYCSMSEW